eukprot:GHVS01062061.1.p1 GENE.GHVS01062061.1~~GHVS01062061.1.p1  ORF type:complete len:273 (-),score=7.40 GHVS01062061.1:518-1336(-)
MLTFISFSMVAAPKGAVALSATTARGLLNMRRSCWCLLFTSLSYFGVFFTSQTIAVVAVSSIQPHSKQLLWPLKRIRPDGKDAGADVPTKLSVSRTVADQIRPVSFLDKVIPESPTYQCHTHTSLVPEVCYRDKVVPQPFKCPRHVNKEKCRYIPVAQCALQSAHSDTTSPQRVDSSSSNHTGRSINIIKQAGNMADRWTNQLSATSTTVGASQDGSSRLCSKAPKYKQSCIFQLVVEPNVCYHRVVHQESYKCYRQQAHSKCTRAKSSTPL